MRHLCDSSKRGISLIELMLAISITLILAGIALYNYEGASTKSKVARVKTEMRTLVTAIEAYSADHNQVPRMASFNIYRDPEFDEYEGIPVNGVMSKVLSTPVAYLSKAFLLDPFMSNVNDAPLDEQFYTYQDMAAEVGHNPKSKFWPKAEAFYGKWRLCSVGPNQLFNEGFANSAQLPYDPTNGSLSSGNIWYGQVTGFGGMPPVPELLGAH